ncbi:MULTISPECIES: nitroreductase family deazaflavin-dependent oxidoreductase [Microbacterium]|uniref:nitroreductase family deazaflavin-dependent oxidoreductase n=1 Tax=Microbacterium TaxID=33882 RepID=UPI0013A5A834|nr:nitroreductase family deazaflavin-dependent oxidoreductase [Microbacterium sp. KCTC 39802]
MNDDVSTALHRSQLIDLTTTGRRSGLPRRIEIFLHEEDGVLFITGMPRRDRTRDWIHNITADPNVIVHLKKGIEADVPVTARVVTDPHEARPLIEAAARRWRRDDVDEMIAHSPLIVLTPATARRLTASEALATVPGAQEQSLNGPDEQQGSWRLPQYPPHER